MDIAAFLGFTEQGPIACAADATITAAGVVQRLTSWKEYQTTYGGLTTTGYLPYAVKAFFANGGTTCYVARIAGASAATAFYSVAGTPSAQVVTSTSAAAAKGQNQLAVEFSGALSPGDTIAFTSGTKSELTRVAQISGSKTVLVKPALRHDHPAGALLAKTAHSASASLTQNAKGGAKALVLDRVAGFAAQSMVVIGGQGHTETATIASVDPASSIATLKAAVQYDHFAGDLVAAQQTAFEVQAASPGAWGGRIWLQITPLDAGSLSLRVTLDASVDSDTPALEEFYPRIQWTGIQQAINGQSQLIVVVIGGQGPMPSFDGAGQYLSVADNADGLTDVSTEDFVGSSTDRRGLRLLEEIDEIGIVCSPDAVFAPVARTIAPPPAPSPCSAPSTSTPSPTPTNLAAPDFPTIYAAIVDHCARMRYRVAVLDAPDYFQLAPAQTAWLNRLLATAGDEAEFAALYHPWIQIVDPLGVDGSMLRFPPSGHVCGTYATTDHTSGVQKPPANVALQYADDLGAIVSDVQQGPLNSANINVIRAFPGRGIRVWGARSLSSDPDWLFIHTRRTLSMIESSVEKSMQWTVFESNTDTLRRSITHSLTVFLEGIWRTGGLQGARPEYGFFVKCDSTNNPQYSIDAGMLICQVGVAIAAPMEFLVFEIRRLIEGSQLVEM